MALRFGQWLRAEVDGVVMPFHSAFQMVFSHRMALIVS